METVWILLGTIAILLTILIACISKATSYIKEVLLNQQELNENIDTIGQIGLNIDIRIRMRHIEFLKKMYNQYISEENYEEVNRLLHIIRQEEDELKKFCSDYYLK